METLLRKKSIKSGNKEQVVSEEKQMKRRQLIRKISLECLKVAAVLLIAFGTAFFWNNQSEKPATKSVVNTLKGQMANITLPDGSRVWLNSNTRIEYSQHFDDLLFILRMTNR